MVRYDKSHFEVFAPDPKCADEVMDEAIARPRPSAFAQIAGIARMFAPAKPSAASKRREARDDRKCFTEFVMRSSYVRAFVGRSSEPYADGTGRFFDGNSMLFELSGGKYTYIGNEMFSFVPSERITSFKSPVMGSDVAYPWAVGEKRIYLMGERVYANNDDVEKVAAKSDFPYDFIYFRHLFAPNDVKGSSVATMRKRKAAAATYELAHKLPGFKLIRKRVV